MEIYTVIDTTNADQFVEAVVTTREFLPLRHCGRLMTEIKITKRKKNHFSNGKNAGKDYTPFMDAIAVYLRVHYPRVLYTTPLSDVVISWTIKR